MQSELEFKFNENQFFSAYTSSFIHSCAIRRRKKCWSMSCLTLSIDPRAATRLDNLRRLFNSMFLQFIYDLPMLPPGLFSETRLFFSSHDTTENNSTSQPQSLTVPGLDCTSILLLCVCDRRKKRKGAALINLIAAIQSRPIDKYIVET